MRSVTPMPVLLLTTIGLLAGCPTSSSNAPATATDPAPSEGIQATGDTTQAPTQASRDTSGTPEASNSDQVGPQGAAFEARGTEPFWYARIDEDELLFAQPDDTLRLAASPPATPANRRPNDLWTWSFDAEGSEPVFLVVQTGECRDGAAGRMHGYEAVLRVGELVVSGCADRLDAGSDASSDS